jgi:hypothetical protein
LSLLRTGQRTRLAALIATGLSIVSTIVSGWLIYAIYTNVDALIRSNVTRPLDARYDAIAAAAAVGRLDVLSMLLALAAIIAGIALIYSYTVFKAAAIEAAVHELRLKLPSALSEHLAQHGERLVVAALKDAELLAHIQRRFTEVGIDDTETAESIDSEPDWKEV